MMNSIIRDYSEKRDFIRMKVNTEISLSLAESNQSIRAVCRNLSGTGMLIEVNEPLLEGSVFNTSLPSNNDAFPSFETKVKVVRCTPTENDCYLVGTEILDIPDQQ